MKAAAIAVLGCAVLACQEPRPAPARDQGAPAPARATDDAGTLAGARADAGAAPGTPAAGPATGAPARAGPIACLDAFLEARNLNEFGDPIGTMYAGGNPLFDERTGTRKDRMAHVRKKHAAALDKACPEAGKDGG